MATYPLEDVLGKKGRQVLDGFSGALHHVFYSIGVAHPGAIALQNYPSALQVLELDDGTHIDLATVEIVRDRERGIPRYNAFRRLLGKPPITEFHELTTDTRLQEKLKDVYGHVDRVDTMIGLLAEKPPDGFGFSDTAFRIFILMASRRLKSDRFYTKPFWNEKTYTRTGMKWIKNNTMTSMLRRHFPGVSKRLDKDANAFQPWERA
jgi:hypothetical protein